MCLLNYTHPYTQKCTLTHTYTVSCYSVTVVGTDIASSNEQVQCLKKWTGGVNALSIGGNTLTVSKGAYSVIAMFLFRLWETS